MTVYVAGSEVEIFSTFNGSVTTDSTVAVSGINRAGVNCLGIGQTGLIEFSPQDEGWLHFRAARIGTSATGGEASREILRLRNSTDQNLFRLWALSGVTNSFEAQILNLTVVPFTNGGGGSDYDVHFKIAETDGFVRVYRDQTLVTEFDGDTRLPSGAQEVGRISISGSARLTSGAATNAAFSQFLVSELPTLGARVHTLPLTAGSVNEWTGSVSDINDSSNTPASLISTNTDEAEILMAAGDISSVATGNAITALVMSTASRALGGAAVTQQIGRVKLGSTTYDMGSAVALSDGFNKVQHILALNPDTTAAWEAADINGAEIGFQALA
jgi:hypothetical protein